MQLPFFFEEDIPSAGNLTLGEGTSKHVIQVLRMQEGEQIMITNGKGELLTAQITTAHKKNTSVNIINRVYNDRPALKVSIAISLIKNANRFEWLLEKATEIGVSEIIPLVCSRTEKHQMKRSRMNTIITSALLQSRQAWLPELREPVNFSDVVKSTQYSQSFIAHCVKGEKKLISDFENNKSSRIILIGPEGDFTEEEISLALENNFVPVSLGETRLRTETAGLVAAVLLLNH
ncbi:MAG: 16S rRNA (uracil(1498)-N(3))-methyltransferase [Bacteroidota bacterium]|nr:16S rRNA (uracil(1498)-N(3))-methyltransferase [Bacteroidota bacterium]